MKLRSILTAAVLSLSACVTPIMAQAQASRNCAPRAAVVERLASTYGETRQSIGLGERGMVIETFASEETGTWTITVTTPNGLTCLVASGLGWEELAEQLPPQGADA